MPYREGKLISTKIEPDRRRQRAVLLVLAGMGLGITVWEIGKRSVAAEPPSVIEVVPVAAPTTVTGPLEPAPSPGPLTTEEIERVVGQHRAALKRTCWDRTGDGRPRTARSTVTLVVGERGDVVEASATGTDPIVASCAEAEVRGWTFPAHGSRSVSIQIPFVFINE